MELGRALVCVCARICVSGGIVIIMYERSAWWWCSAGWRRAHARCFNGLMSIYGLSSELTASYSLCFAQMRAP